METIIGLLFIILPLVFKLIEKKLQTSGKSEQAGKIRELAELFEESDESEELEESAFETDPAPAAEPVTVVPYKPELVKVKAPEPVKTFVEGQKAVRRKAEPVLMEETDTKKKEKIDPKKLVIYSEIMKPKFQE